jgi:uncharacterized protein YuzE
MKISYDPKVDAMYISFKKGKYDHTKKVTEEVMVDVTSKGDILGLEILDAKKKFGDIKSEKIEISTKPSYQSA